jgi:ribokinase
VARPVSEILAKEVRAPMSRIVVFGSSNTDMTVCLPCLPAPGQTVLGDRFSTTPGGKGANQAVAAARSGGDVCFITAVGHDELGAAALAGYQREGIDVSFARKVDGTPSGVALIFVGEDGENMIGVASGANLKLAPDDVDRVPDSVFQAGHVLLVGLEIPVETALRAMERGRRAGMPVILNPAPAHALSTRQTTALLKTADVITPNQVEALALAGMAATGSANEPDWEQCADRLLEAGAGSVVITLGARGCLVATRAQTCRIAASRVEVCDTVGAGDAFNGALAVALAERKPLVAAAGWASAAAALAVTRRGAQPSLPFREAIERLASQAAGP